MKLLLVICFVSVSSCYQNKGFANLVASLQDDDSIDMEDVLNSEEIYIKALSHKEDVLYSEIELLVGAEEEEMADEEEEEDEENNSEPDMSDYPEELDLRDLGIIHPNIWQGLCGSCGFISGTQTLEARIALVSENYIPYSIQNFMNCQGKICTGVQPYSIQGYVRRSGFIVPEDEIPYTRRKCVQEGEGKSACYEKCGALHPNNFTNTLHDQFVIVSATAAAHTEAQLIAALQNGPATTCFTRSNKPEGERCAAGCAHANSIIGYTKDNLMVQENYSKKYGPFKDGTWVTPRNSSCAAALIKKAYLPIILYDYDRANAYFTQIKAGLKEEELSFADKVIYGITVNITRNWGTAKNKCAFLGSACKGVVAVSSGTFELVSDFGVGSPGPQKAFKKFQMVIYLKHERTGRYIGIKTSKGGRKSLITVKKDGAAPFFTSYARFVSFDYPTYRMTGNELTLIKRSIRDIAFSFETKKEWSLSNCMIYNAASNKSFDVVSGEKGDVYLGSAAMNKKSLSQRFDVGISGQWSLTSNKLGIALAEIKNKKTENEHLFVEPGKNISPINFLWQTRQIMANTGSAIGSDMKFSEYEFDTTSRNKMSPTDCAAYTDEGRYLVVDRRGTLSTSDSQGNNGWTFEYADL